MAILLLLICIPLINGNNFDLLSEKRAFIKNECKPLGDELEKLNTSDARCGVRLSSMASEVILHMGFERYTVNSFIPNLLNDKLHQVMTTLNQFTAAYLTDLQTATTGTCEHLKTKLISAAPKIYEAVTYFEQEKQNTPLDPFAANQLRRKYDLLIFIMFKLKNQARFFQKNNDELAREIKKSLSKLLRIIEDLPSDHEVVAEELRFTMLHLSLITHTLVIKLGNWVEINLDKDEEVKIVRDVSDSLSQMYYQLNRDINENHDAEYLKKRFAYVLKNGVEKAVALAKVKYADKLGWEEFIWESLIDAFTIGKAYSANLRTILQEFYLNSTCNSESICILQK